MVCVNLLTDGALLAHFRFRAVGSYRLINANMTISRESANRGISLLNRLRFASRIAHFSSISAHAQNNIELKGLSLRLKQDDG